MDIDVYQRHSTNKLSEFVNFGLMSSSIYLPTLEDHSASVLILVIPFADIRRLSTKPLKWLRYVLFAICGVQGDMSLTANGPPVNYDGDVLANDYYFTPQGRLMD